MRLTPERPGPIARVLDAAVAAAFPGWGLRRSVARARMAQANAVRLAYDAARRDRVRSEARAGSADADLLADLRILRTKSRALVRDDAHAAAAVQVIVDNVVGCGIRPQAAARPDDTGLTQEQCDAWNAAVERVWWTWAAGACDANGLCDWDELTRLVYRTKVVDGENLAHRVFRNGSTSWELIDVDRLEDPAAQTDNLRHGVEINQAGEPIAYWITPVHPDDVRYLRSIRNNLPVRIARKLDTWPNVLHLFRRQRPGQSRGIPAITAALPLFEHLHHYLDSEIIAARANANVAMVVKRPVDKTDADLLPITGETDSNGEPTVHYHQTIEAGTIEYLNEGEEMQAFTPNRPGSAFEPFVVRVLKAICAALNVSYELVTKDFGGSNYSSSRASLLECRRGFECEQNHLIAGWCRPAWETRIREAIAAGELPKFPQMDDPEIGIAPFLEARWIRGAWGWVDPVKEIDAARQAVESNLSTPQHEAARAGMDVEEILEAKARFLVQAREIEERNGLEPGALTAVGKPAPAAPAAADPQGDGEQDPDQADEPDPEDGGEDGEPEEQTK